MERKFPVLSSPGWGFPGVSDGKESARQCRRYGFDPWRGKWQSTPVFLPGESHGQRSLMGYSPWGRKSRTLSDYKGAIITSLDLLATSPHPQVQVQVQVQLLSHVRLFATP